MEINGYEQLKQILNGKGYNAANNCMDSLDLVALELTGFNSKDVVSSSNPEKVEGLVNLVQEFWPKVKPEGYGNFNDKEFVGYNIPVSGQGYKKDQVYSLVHGNPADIVLANQDLELHKLVNFRSSQDQICRNSEKDIILFGDGGVFTMKDSDVYFIGRKKDKKTGEQRLCYWKCNLEKSEENGLLEIQESIREFISETKSIPNTVSRIQAAVKSNNGNLEILNMGVNRCSVVKWPDYDKSLECSCYQK